MLVINQFKISYLKDLNNLKSELADYLRIDRNKILNFEVLKLSIDARKKPDIFYVLNVAFSLQNEAELYKKLSKNKAYASKIQQYKVNNYIMPKLTSCKDTDRPVVVGSGPAGLFCALLLAENGLKPIVLERGEDVDKRSITVDKFWNEGILNEQSNVQFGEGGAGTFSDGKLATGVGDKAGRNKFIMETFVSFGAPDTILYDNKPHIGTDILKNVVKNMRNHIISLGGEFRFNNRFDEAIIEDKQLTGIKVSSELESYNIKTKRLILATGHSARDTFKSLYAQGINMESKSISVGFRVQHPQAQINMAMYGMTDADRLGAAPYKVTAKSNSGRGVFSFCMCPGGYVVNASSIKGTTVVNGMSYSGRSGPNANSAIIVQVNPEDYGYNHPLSGLDFQSKLEEKAYKIAGGKVPIQRFGLYKYCVLNNISEDSLSDEDKIELSKLNLDMFLKHSEFIVNEITNPVEPAIKGNYEFADLSDLLGEEISKSFVEGMEAFARSIPGFDRQDAILAGIESRTSSPVRILRDEEFQANIRGIYPCGEGAGYAGGITSAAMDGMKVAEKIIEGWN